MTKRFECVRCGSCCRQSGDLRLLPEDVEKLLDFLGIDYAELCRRYPMSDVDGKLFFLGVHNACPFLAEDDSCILEGKAKPFFCANYLPFIDKEDSPIYKVCQGIGHGREWTEEEIQEIYERMKARLVIVREGGDAEWQ